MKATKKKLLATLATAFVLSGAAAVTSLGVLAKAEGETAGIDSFNMLYGATIRTVENSPGIRFTATFSNELYQTVTTDDTDTSKGNKQFGMVITKNDWLVHAPNKQYIEELGTANCILITEESANPLTPYLYKAGATEAENVYAINGSITNVQYANSNVEWFAVGVVITTDGTNTTYEYADFVEGDNVRTMTEVATAALEDPDIDSKYDSMLMDYVYRSAAVAVGKTKTEYEAMEPTAKTELLATFSLSSEAEVYLTAGDANKALKATATNGTVSFPVRASWTVADTTKVKLDTYGKLQYVDNGYSLLTAESSIFTDPVSVKAYTGSLQLFDEYSDLRMGGSAEKSVVESGKVIDGRTAIARSNTTNTTNRHMAVAPNNISRYWLEYMSETMDYKYIRHYMYVESSSYTTFTYKSIIAKTVAGGSTDSTKTFTNMPTNRWITVDIPVGLYIQIITNCEASGFTDENGMFVTKKGNAYTANYFCNRAAASYIGVQELVKESAKNTISETEVTATFAEAFDLSEKYPVEGGAQANYKAYGKICNTGLTPVLASTEVTVSTTHLRYAYGSSGDHTTMTGTNISVSATKTLTVENGLNVKEVNLVDTEATYDIDALTGKTQVESAGLTAEYSIVKRYSDGTAVDTLDTTTAESGIYYYTVNVSKDGEALVSYETTIDLYKTSEGIEYESFTHTDSAYAIYSINQSETNRAQNTEFTPSNIGGALYTNKAELEEGDTTTLQYVLNMTGTTAMPYENKTTKTPVGSVDVDMTIGYPDAERFIYFYILPRHTVEYYQMWYETYGDVSLESYVSVVVAAEHLKMFNFSSGTGSTITYGYIGLWNKTSNLFEHSLTKIIDNYDNLYNGKIDMYHVRQDANTTSLRVHGIATALPEATA